MIHFLRTYLLILLIFPCICNAINIKDPHIEKRVEDIEALKVHYIYSDGKITTTHHDSAETVVRVYGRQDALDALEFVQDDDKLKLQYINEVVHRDNIKVYIEITMPQSTDLKFNIINGKWEIDDITGDVKYNAYGNGYAAFNSINADNVKLTLNGSGKVLIKSGEIDDFHGKIMGSGEIKFLGAADIAELEIFGSGQIQVNKIHDHITNQSVFGSGRVRVKNMPSSSRPKFSSQYDPDATEFDINQQSIGDDPLEDGKDKDEDEDISVLDVIIDSSDKE